MGVTKTYRNYFLGGIGGSLSITEFCGTDAESLAIDPVESPPSRKTLPEGFVSSNISSAWSLRQDDNINRLTHAEIAINFFILIFFFQMYSSFPSIKNQEPFAAVLS